MIMIRLRFLMIALTLLGAAENNAFGQQVFTLTIDGEVAKPLKLSLKRLESFPSVEFKAVGHDKKEHVYKGVMIFTLLDSAGVTLGAKLRGKNLGKYLVAKASDGYQAVYALPEVDPEFTDEKIIVAYLEDGKPLATGDGPVRVVVPGDKKHARWVRELVSLNVNVSK